MEEEKKAKEDEERWRREKEKEDTTEKRSLRPPGKKVRKSLKVGTTVNLLLLS